MWFQQPTTLNIFWLSTKTLLSEQINSSVSLTTQVLFNQLQTLLSVHSCTLRMSLSSSVSQVTLSSLISTTYQLNMRKSLSEQESSLNAPPCKIKPYNWLCQDQHQLLSTQLWLLCCKPLCKVKFYTPHRHSHWQLLLVLSQKLVVRSFKTFHCILRSVHLSVEVMSVLYL